MRSCWRQTIYRHPSRTPHCSVNSTASNSDWYAPFRVSSANTQLLDKFPCLHVRPCSISPFYHTARFRLSTAFSLLMESQMSSFSDLDCSHRAHRVAHSGTVILSEYTNRTDPFLLYADWLVCVLGRPAWGYVALSIGPNKLVCILFTIHRSRDIDTTTYKTQTRLRLDNPRHSFWQYHRQLSPWTFHDRQHIHWRSHVNTCHSKPPQIRLVKHRLRLAQLCCQPAECRDARIPLPPHIFQLTNNAYYHMRQTGQGQSMLFRCVHHRCTPC